MASLKSKSEVSSEEIKSTTVADIADIQAETFIVTSSKNQHSRDFLAHTDYDERQSF